MTTPLIRSKESARGALKAFVWALGTFSVLGGAETVVAPVDLQVVVQPIIVLDDEGGSAPTFRGAWFEPHADRIWAQAGIDIAFLAPRELRSSAYQALETTAEIDRLFTDSEAGASADPLTLNMWIVRSVSGAFGRAVTGRNGIVIGEVVFTHRDSLGRLDTIAHEIGHNLGLDHQIYGAGGSDNLMTASGRESPAALCDIHPTESGTDRLNDVQIAVARASKFARPLVSSEAGVRFPSAELRLDRDGVLKIVHTDCGCYSIETRKDLSEESEWSLWKSAVAPELGSISIIPSKSWEGSGFFRATPDILRVIERR